MKKMYVKEWEGIRNHNNNDYCRLIKSFWRNVTKYENTQEK